jgi:hypothetical protein
MPHKQFLVEKSIGLANAKEGKLREPKSSNWNLKAKIEQLWNLGDINQAIEI